MHVIVGQTVPEKNKVLQLYLPRGLSLESKSKVYMIPLCVTLPYIPENRKQFIIFNDVIRLKYIL